MRGYLCDTHVVLWAGGSPERLRPHVQELLASFQEQIFVSSISIAEMVIKRNLGKLQLPDAMSPIDLCEALQFEPLPLVWAHSAAVDDLPPIHRDPFDRLLIAQALAEDLTLITADADVLSYPNVLTLAA
jgi:PIN domain nuclease of toxin-antitoxin system